MTNKTNERVAICKECEEAFIVNRLGQLYCSKSCRNRANNRIVKLSKSATEKIDKILHRNRLILSQQIGKKLTIKALKSIGFNFSHITGIRKKEGKTYFFCYEFFYRLGRDQEVYIFQLNPESNEHGTTANL